MSYRHKISDAIETLPKETKVKIIDTKFDWHKIVHRVICKLKQAMSF